MLNQSNVVIGAILPAFTYNGKVREGVKVHKIHENKLTFVGELAKVDFYANPEYRTFDMNKVQVQG